LRMSMKLSALGEQTETSAVPKNDFDQVGSGVSWCVRW
jgi:hypothetical protein